MTKKVMSIMGTRPEMIKMWSVIKKLDDSCFEHIMVHTGQNYTPELKDFFFRDLELRKPNYNLSIDVSSYGKEVADVIYKSEELFDKEKPKFGTSSFVSFKVILGLYFLHISATSLTVTLSLVKLKS